MLRMHIDIVRFLLKQTLQVSVGMSLFMAVARDTCSAEPALQERDNGGCWRFPRLQAGIR